MKRIKLKTVDLSNDLIFKKKNEKSIDIMVIDLVCIRLVSRTADGLKDLT